MVGVANIGKNASNVTKSVLLQPYSKVVIIVDEDTEYVAGDDSGLTLEIQNPWGTQEIANDILRKILGYQYQPYTATTAIVDPAVEMGDAVQVNGVYGGIYQQDATFGRTFYSDLSAPEDEKLDNENPYVSPTERRITREKAWTKAELKILDDKIGLEVTRREEDSTEFRGALEAQATEISAKVSQTGGSNSSFGWSLLSNEFGLYAGNSKVFYCNSGGIVVNGSGTFSGTITAKSGRIGANSNGTGGFIITANKMYTDGHPAYNTNATGVYIGTDGLGIGANKFTVTNAGKLTATDVDITGKITATSGSFTGSITATSGTFHGSVQCTSIRFDSGAYLDGSNITAGTIGSTQIGNGAVTNGKISDGSVSSGKISDGSVTSGKIGSGAVTNGKISDKAVTKGKTDNNVQTSLGNADSAKDTVTKLMSGTTIADNLASTKLTAGMGGLYVRTSTGSARRASWKTTTISGVTINYLGY